jgi:hypothetical protein
MKARGKSIQAPELDPGQGFCKRCLSVQFVENFGPSYGKKNLNGYHQWCKSCRTEYQTKKRNQEGRPFSWIVRGMQDKTIALTCHDCGELKMQAQMSTSFRKCKECDSLQSAMFRQGNPEYKSEWGISNPDKGNEYSQRRAKRIQKNGAFKIISKDWRRITNQPCGHCGAIDDIHRDHRIPISRGGRHSIGNLMPLCRTCNTRKHTKTYAEFRYGR